jgi:hypothetical protein
MDRPPAKDTSKEDQAQLAAEKAIKAAERARDYSFCFVFFACIGKEKYCYVCTLLVPLYIEKRGGLFFLFLEIARDDSCICCLLDHLCS